ncbi:MAG: ParB/RepB/Spo0J family partition protein [Eubacterium sp.]|nr:ParB/RepB/Spo0J family partition protein [Eubacterium sp.]
MALGKGYNTLLGVDSSDKAAKKTTTKSTKPAKKPAQVPTKTVIKEVIKEVPAETKLKLSEIEPNTGQPRKEFNEDLLAELADSIKKYGIIQPIVVTKKGKGYQIIAGERRWRAARMAGLKEIPAIVREYTDKESMEVALIENLQRSDLNAVEEALAYQNLIEVYNLKQDEVAERVSKSRTAVTNSLRLLKLCDKVKQMLVDDMISTGHARALLAIEDPNVQYETALSVFDEGLSVRETEQLVKGVNNILSGNEIDDNGQIKVKKKDEALEAILNSMAEDLKTIIGSKVAIKSTGNGKKGKLEIEYVSNDDLERIIHIIKAGAAL